MSKDFIRIGGARQHNLKNLNISIPRDKLVVITGLSGSGKSTLAFDIVFAEGQRRFLDSMSPYARQFVEQLEKPDVDLVDGLPPSVAIFDGLIAPVTSEWTWACRTCPYRSRNHLITPIGSRRQALPEF